MRKELNSQRNCLDHQHGRRFIVLEHQYCRRDVMWKRSIIFEISKSTCQLMSLLFYFGENDTNEKRVSKAGILEISRLRLAISLLWILLWLFFGVFVDFFFPILCVNKQSPMSRSLLFLFKKKNEKLLYFCVFYKRNRSVVLTGRIFKLHFWCWVNCSLKITRLRLLLYKNLI